MDSEHYMLSLLSLQAPVASSRVDAHSLPHIELARASLCLSHSQKHFYQTGNGWTANNTGQFQSGVSISCFWLRSTAQ